MNSPNPTLKQYVSGLHKDQVDFALKYGEFNPMDVFDIGDIFERTFGFVKRAQEIAVFHGFSFEKYIEFLLETKVAEESTIYNTGVLDFQCSIVYLNKEIETINELESTALGSEPTADEVSAGIEEFKVFRSYLQFDSLSGGDITKHKAIEELKYSECFTKLKLEDVRAKFNERLIKIRSRKNKP